MLSGRSVLSIHSVLSTFSTLSLHSLLSIHIFLSIHSALNIHVVPSIHSVLSAYSVLSIHAFLSTRCPKDIAYPLSSIQIVLIFESILRFFVCLEERVVYCGLFAASYLLTSLRLLSWLLQ